MTKPVRWPTCCRIYIASATLLWAASVTLAQTTYYVADEGSDANEGRSVAMPFKSLNRVNSLMLRPGDVVLFRRGDAFQGTLRIRQSGTTSAPIRFDAYGTGDKPVISGSSTLHNWQFIGKGIWEASCSTCGNEVTGVYINGKAQPLGRYPNLDGPNGGNLTLQSSLNATQLSSRETLTTNWVGGEAVVRPTYWIIDRATITHQSGNILTLDNASTYSLTNGWGFFIQNHPATLDQPGEWYYNPTTQTIRLYSLSNPNDQLITTTAFDEAVRIENVSYITMENLTITQARRSNVYAINAAHLTLTHLDIHNAGEDGLVVQGTGQNVVIEQCTLTTCNNNGMYIGAYQDVFVRQNTLKCIGLFRGRGKSGDGHYIGLQSMATRNLLIERNSIDSIGYNGITTQGSTTIRHNLIAHFCMAKSDGGGIYLWNGNELPVDSVVIQSNIIRAGVGTAGGLTDTSVGGANGIFLDDCVKHVTISKNTIADCQGLGFYLHAVSDVKLMDNTCFNNSAAQLILYNYQNRCFPRNNVLTGNILVAKTAAQSVAGYISGADDLPQFGRMEQNYYARPFNDLSTIRAVYNSDVVADLNVDQWQTEFGQDRWSQASPLTYKDYRVISRSRQNGINSVSTENSGGWDTWSRYNNGQVSWNTENQLATNRLTIYFSSASGQADSYVVAYTGINPVVQAKTYLVHVEASAPKAQKITVFIRQRQSPYQDLTRRFEFMAGPARKNYEFALTATTHEADALLAFQLEEDNQPVWLDNIQLEEAIIEPVNPDEWIRFVCNPTAQDSTVFLDKVYRDVRNRTYSGQVTLKPFTSVVLLRDTVPSTLVTAVQSNSLLADRFRIYPNPTFDEFIFSADEDIATLRLINYLGQEVFSYNTIRRNQQIQFGQSLLNACYVAHIQYKTGEQRTVKLIKSGR